MKQKEISGPGEKRPVHPSIFMVLFLPFGVLTGYVTVTIGFLLTENGIPLAKVAPIVALTLLPNIFKFLWAPLVDTILTVKRWYIIANIITAAGILFTGMLPLKVEYLFLMTVIVLITGFANTFIAMSTESLAAHDTPPEQKGRAGGWLQAGNLGGLGLGGGAGLWLAQRLPEPWMPGAVIAASCLLCTAGLVFLPEPTRFIRDSTYLKTIRNLNRDIWTLLKSRMGGLISKIAPVNKFL